MLSTLITIFKLLILLGFLIIIHESGHFFVAKLCNVKVNQFSIGFGPQLWKKQGKETLYTVRLIPLGGFVSMEGEDEESDDNRSFSKANIPKRLAIVFAGATVNILFGVLIYGFLSNVNEVWNLIYSLGEGILQLVTGKIGINQMVGPVGIGGIIAQTSGIREFLLLLSVISVSLGVTNLLPIPALDGGKIVLLVIEAIRKKPLKQEIEIKIQLLGFALLITLSVIVMYQDISRLIN